LDGDIEVIDEAVSAVAKCLTDVENLDHNATFFKTECVYKWR